MKTEDILKKIEELTYYEVINFIGNLKLTPNQLNILADHDKKNVRWGLAENPNLTKEVMIKLASDEDADVRISLTGNPNLTEKVIIQLASDEIWNVKYKVFEKLKDLNSLKKEELEDAYDLIMKSKYIGRKNFEETFDYIIDKFPEVSELAKMFKKLVLKLKKDLK